MIASIITYSYTILYANLKLIDLTHNKSPFMTFLEIRKSTQFYGKKSNFAKFNNCILIPLLSIVRRLLKCTSRWNPWKQRCKREKLWRSVHFYFKVFDLKAIHVRHMLSHSNLMGEYLLLLYGLQLLN